MDANDLKLLFESIDVRAQSKANELPEDACLRRFKDKWLFLTTLAMILSTVTCLSLFILFRPESSNTGIAWNSLMSLVMALAGYYVRGKTE
jgi:hypothetical protein